MPSEWSTTGTLRQEERMIDQERLKQVSDRILADLRATVTEFRIDEEEIHDAARFFDRLGQAGEFSDLLDNFLATTSVIALSGEGGTTPNLSGPYYKGGAPLRKDGNLVERELGDGEIPLTVSGQVLDAATNLPVPDAVLDIWQADGKGVYDETGYDLRGLVKADDAGRYAFHTLFPEGYEIPAKGPTTELLGAIGQQNWRPAHIHLRVYVGDRTALQTQFFLAGADFLDCDPVDAVRQDLIIEHRDAPGAGGREANLDIRLALDRPLPPRSFSEGPKVEIAAR
jgi:protocatechuate 3,4-dioxygenase beta subunit